MLSSHGIIRSKLKLWKARVSNLLATIGHSVERDQIPAIQNSPQNRRHLYKKFMNCKHGGSENDLCAQDLRILSKKVPCGNITVSAYD